jgi:hypothetical protein
MASPDSSVWIPKANKVPNLGEQDRTALGTAPLHLAETKHI